MEMTFLDRSQIPGIEVIYNLSLSEPSSVNLKVQGADQFQVTLYDFVFPARIFPDQSAMQSEIIMFTWGHFGWGE